MSYNYRHLYYFWVVAKQGSMSKAAETLDMAIQTVSAQVHELEKSLGYLLFKPAGRGITLTEAGYVTLNIADQIFSIGEKLPEALKEASLSPKHKIIIGVADGLPKMVTRQLVDTIVQRENTRMVIYEGKFDGLLADLALHRLDLVLADRPAPSNLNLKVYSKELTQSFIGWYGTSKYVKESKHSFPESLNYLPILLPTTDSLIRGLIDQWFTKHNIVPNIVGEFEDSSLLKTFAASGMGICPACKLIQKELKQSYQMEYLGNCDNVLEYFYGIHSEKKIQNPLVDLIINQP